MNLAIGERRMEAENDVSGDGEFDWERKCGSHFWISKW